MVSFNALLVLANYLLSGNLPADSDTPEVTLGKARIVGHYDATNDVDAFLGVRYASAKRFERAAMVHYKEEERINATVHAPACAQINSGVRAHWLAKTCVDLCVHRLGLIVMIVFLVVDSYPFTCLCSIRVRCR
jgi:hypothetical protein